MNSNKNSKRHQRCWRDQIRSSFALRYIYSAIAYSSIFCHVRFHLVILYRVAYLHDYLKGHRCPNTIVISRTLYYRVKTQCLELIGWSFWFPHRLIYNSSRFGFMQILSPPCCYWTTWLAIIWSKPCYCSIIFYQKPILIRYFTIVCKTFFYPWIIMGIAQEPVLGDWTARGGVARWGMPCPCYLEPWG